MCSLDWSTFLNIISGTWCVLCLIFSFWMALKWQQVQTWVYKAELCFWSFFWGPSFFSFFDIFLWLFLALLSNYTYSVHKVAHLSLCVLIKDLEYIVKNDKLKCTQTSNCASVDEWMDRKLIFTVSIRNICPVAQNYSDCYLLKP